MNDFLIRVSLILLATFMVLNNPFALAENHPEDPRTAPVDVTFPESGGGFGNLELIDDTVRFVWSSCVQEGAGCNDIWNRDYNPGEDLWSDPDLLWDGPVDAGAPKIVTGGENTYLFWIEDENNRDIRWCKHDGECEPSTLNTPGSEAGNLVAAATPDGRLMAAWQEEFEDTSRIVFRAHDGLEWGPVVHFETQSASQRHPTLAVDSTGRSHLAWQESLSNANKDDVNRRVMYATVDQEGEEPSSAETIAVVTIDSLTRPTIAIGVGDRIGLAFNNPQDTYFQEKFAGEDSWTDAVNVTRTGVPGRQSEIRLLPVPEGDWKLTYRTGTVGDMRLWLVDRVEGQWMKPRVVVGGDDRPEEYVLSPSVDHDPSTGLHMAWTWPGDGEPKRMFYHRMDKKIEGEPPEITRLNPKPDTWTKQKDLDVEVFFTSSAPVDVQRSTIKIDGSEVPVTMKYVHDIPALIGSIKDLDDGEHVGQVTVWDADERSVSTEWTVSVDTAPPKIETSWRVGADDVAEVSGWYEEPVAFAVRTHEEETGSPHQVEVSFNDGFSYHSMEDALGDLGWTQDDGMWSLPENESFTLRFRARDEAGNADRLSPVTVGWDRTPPNGTLKAPAWSRSDVNVEVDLEEDKGSPLIPVFQIIDEQNLLVDEVKAEGENGTVFPDLPEGNYSVEADITDQAGNRMDPPPETLRVGVDRTAPVVSLESTRLKATDTMSGLATVRITDEAGTMNSQWNDLNGTSRWEHPVDWPEHTDRLKASVTDVAGNEWTGVLDPEEGAVDNGIGDHQTGLFHQDEEDTGSDRNESRVTPAPGALLLASAIVLPFLLKRYGTKSRKAWQ